MERVALLRRANEVKRQIFASLPWGVRLAAAFVAIANETAYLNLWAKFVGAVMLQAGVTDMPEPGPKWDPAKHNPANNLPNGYMGQFMSGVYGLLLKSFHDPSLAEDAIANYIGKLGAGQIKLKAVPRATAESFIRHGIMLEARTQAREKLRERARSESLEDVADEAKSVSRDIDDPEALMHLRREYSDRMWNEWMAYLAKHVHPDAPLYLKYRMEGYTNEEILGVPKDNQPSMLPHWKGTPQNWKNYKDKMIDRSVEFLHSKGEDVPATV
jgi:hypothetical protein